MVRANSPMLLACLILCLPGVSSAGEESNRISAAESEPQNWLTHGRTYGEQRHGPLAQINTETVSRLGLVWAMDMETTRELEATPLIVDGAKLWQINFGNGIVASRICGVRVKCQSKVPE